jgi:hypothetical protein
MKKKLLPLLAIVVLAAAIYSVYQRRSGTTREELKDFAVKDTALISQIFLSDRSGNSIKLNRLSDRNWLVNDSIVAIWRRAESNVKSIWTQTNNPKKSITSEVLHRTQPGPT